MLSPLPPHLQLLQLSRRACCPARRLHTASVLSGFRDKFVWAEDLNKRPSEVEIRKKDLPPNTPTLGERIRRDRKHMVHEYDRKGGYYRGKTGTWRDYAEDMDTKTVFWTGFDFLKKESVKFWKDELTANQFENRPRVGDVRTEWDFSAEDTLDREWVTTCDSDWGEGYSKCALERSPDGRYGIFSGELSTRVPRDGRIAKAGYCNMAGVQKFNAFNRFKDLQWYLFTDLVMLVRGDGRTYRVQLHAPLEFDIGWNDLWVFPLFTRGGPYWQHVKIPFSKFLFSARGYIQDKQERVPLHRVTQVSISLADKIDGPFRLEVQNIGVHKQPEGVSEQFRYETYYYPYPNYNIM